MCKSDILFLKDVSTYCKNNKSGTKIELKNIVHNFGVTLVFSNELVMCLNGTHLLTGCCYIY